MKITIKKVPERRPYIVRVDYSDGSIVARAYVGARFFTKQEAQEFRQQLYNEELLKKLEG